MSNIKTQLEQSIEIYFQVARSAAAAGDQALSLRMCLAALSRVKASPKLFSPKLLINLADLLLLAAEIDKAEEAYNHALNNLRGSGEKNCWLTARIYDGLTTVHISKTETQKALRACQLTVSNLRKIANINKSLMAARVKRLAWLSAESGETLKAAELCREAASLTSDHVAPVATPRGAAALAQSALSAGR